MIDRISDASLKILSQSQLNLRNMASEASFESLIKEKLNTEGRGELQFSKHAQKRATERGIDVSSDMLDRLNEAVDKAREKGAKDIAVIGRNEAFIVNVPNNVVVTTIAGKEMKDSIFTNIDSAVIL